MFGKVAGQLEQPAGLSAQVDTEQANPCDGHSSFRGQSKLFGNAAGHLEWSTSTAEPALQIDTAESDPVAGGSSRRGVSKMFGKAAGSFEWSASPMEPVSQVDAEEDNPAEGRSSRRGASQAMGEAHNQLEWSFAVLEPALQVDVQENSPVERRSPHPEASAILGTAAGQCEWSLATVEPSLKNNAVVAKPAEGCSPCRGPSTRFGQDVGQVEWSAATGEPAWRYDLEDTRPSEGRASCRCASTQVWGDTGPVEWSVASAGQTSQADHDQALGRAETHAPVFSPIPPCGSSIGGDTSSDLGHQEGGHGSSIVTMLLRGGLSEASAAACSRGPSGMADKPVERESKPARLVPLGESQDRPSKLLHEGGLARPAKLPSLPGRSDDAARCQQDDDSVEVIRAMKSRHRRQHRTTPPADEVGKVEGKAWVDGGTVFLQKKNALLHRQ